MIEQITTSLGIQIIAEAQRWLDLECVEKGGDSNKLYCANSDDPSQRITWKAFNDKLSAEPYCAAFVWEVVSGACKNAGVDNKLPLSGSAVGLRDKGKNAGMRLDKEPAPGCMYYHKNGSQSHVGIVKEVQQNYVVTIEANTTKGNEHGIFEKERQIDSKTIKSMNISFLHLEEMHGTETMAQILPKGESNGSDSGSLAINTGNGRIVVSAGANGLKIKHRREFF